MQRPAGFRASSELAAPSVCWVPRVSLGGGKDEAGSGSGEGDCELCVLTSPRACIRPSRHVCASCEADLCSHHTCLITWGVHFGSAGQGTDSPCSLPLPTPPPCFQTSPLGVHRLSLPPRGSPCPSPLQSPFSTCSLILRDPVAMSPLSVWSESAIASPHTPARSHASVSVPRPGLRPYSWPSLPQPCQLSRAGKVTSPSCESTNYAE